MRFSSFIFVKMNSDEEAYNKFIVTSDDEEAEKENISAKKPKTSQQQFDLMTAFAKDYNEQTTPKETYDEGWNSLAQKLNEVGPPIRDVWEWRRTWSLYKYNQKRKHQSDESAGKRRSHQVKPSVYSIGDRPPITVSGTQPSTSDQVLEKLDQILAVVKDSNVVLKEIAAKRPQ